MTLAELNTHLHPYGLDAIAEPKGEGAGFYVFRGDVNVFRLDFTATERSLGALLAMIHATKTTKVK